jgi:hypothetical protein
MLSKEELEKLSRVASQSQAIAETLSKGTEPLLAQVAQQQKLLQNISTPIIPTFDLPEIVIPKIEIPDYSYIFNDLQENIKSIIETTLIPSQSIQEVFSPLNPSYFDQLNRISKQIADSFTPSNLFKDVFERIRNWEDGIEKEVFEVCKKYHFFISPNTPREIIYFLFEAHRENAKRRTIEKEFYKFYEKDNWEILDFYKKWQGSKFLKKRIPVIRDVVNYVKKTKKPSAKIILPVIISQIDGILLDIARNNGISIKMTNGKHRSQSEWHSELFIFLSSKSREITSDIGLNICELVLFQKAKTGKKPEKEDFGFNRHKIMHGEYVRGLTPANMIRAFLLLDFLSQFLISTKDDCLPNTNF